MDNQNISSENQQQNAPATPLPNSQGGQYNLLPADIEAIIPERMAWEAERVSQDHARSSYVGNPLSNNPDVYAKPFPNSLTGKAKDWYMALPLKMIDIYQQTADVFVAKFVIVVQKRHDERILMDIQQGKNESLISYHGCYNNLLMNVPIVDDKVTYMAFFKGLMYGKLKKVLLVRTTLTKDELTATVTTDIELEELRVGARPVDLKEKMLQKDGKELLESNMNTRVTRVTKPMDDSV
ncbi:hypothetical protein LIER_38969 [Lithospermum erythrorhizon]|uniref:Retrotransposon gag domain-containing protein n=1 Tax=Lithospermum erythrorhizon TaxID=34254 RepID=A0AAV3Q7Z4_LITER